MAVRRHLLSRQNAVRPVLRSLSPLGAAIKPSGKVKEGVGERRAEWRRGRGEAWLLTVDDEAHGGAEAVADAVGGLAQVLALVLGQRGPQQQRAVREELQAADGAATPRRQVLVLAGLATCARGHTLGYLPSHASTYSMEFRTPAKHRVREIRRPFRLTSCTEDTDVAAAERLGEQMLDLDYTLSCGCQSREKAVIKYSPVLNSPPKQPDRWKASEGDNTSSIYYD
ncbi:Protein of unknown function [Gryllus bimaculatus]|nr:Protein of unknown function [Gryllus bimaculatus]